MRITSFRDDAEKMADFYSLDKDEFLKSYCYLTESEYIKTLMECRDWVEEHHRGAALDLNDANTVRCYYRLMHDLNLDLYEADRYVWLCTLFGYDIGEDTVKAICNWMYVNGQDTLEITAAQKDLVREICEEVDEHPCFIDWAQSEPKAFGYEWMGKLRFPEPKRVKLQKIIRIGNYTLVKRDSKYEPFVAAYMYSDQDDTWGNGTYFDSGIDALMYILQRERSADIISAAVNICDREKRDDIADLLVEMNGL